MRSRAHSPALSALVLLAVLSSLAFSHAVITWEARPLTAAESDLRPPAPFAICQDPVDPHVVYHVIGTAHAYGWKGPAISTFNSTWGFTRGASAVNATRLLAPHALVSQTRMEEMFGCVVSEDGGFVAFLGALHAVSYRIVTPGVLEFYAVLARSAAAQAAYALGLASDGGATAAAQAAAEYVGQFPHWTSVALHRSGWPASFLGSSGDLVLTGTYYDTLTTTAYTGESNGGGKRFIYVAGADGIYRQFPAGEAFGGYALGRAGLAVMGAVRSAFMTSDILGSLAGYLTASVDYNPVRVSLRRRREGVTGNWSLSDVQLDLTDVTNRVARKNLTSLIGIVGKSPYTARVYLHEHINANGFGDFKVCTLRYDDSLGDAKVVEACQTAASGMRCKSATAARVVPIPGARLDATWCSTRILYVFNDVYNAYTSLDVSATFSDASTVSWTSSDAARGIFVAADSTGATVVGIASEAPTAYKAIQPAAMRVRVGGKVVVITNTRAQENSTLDDLHAHIVDPGEEYATTAEKAVVLETITPAQNTTAPAISVTFTEVGHQSGLAAYTLTRSSNVAGAWSSDGLAVLASGSSPNLRPGLVEVALAYTPTTQPFGERQTIKGTMFVEPFDRQHIRTLATHVSVVNGTTSAVSTADSVAAHVVALVRGASGSTHEAAGVPAVVIIAEGTGYYARRINAATGTWEDTDFAPSAMLIPSGGSTPLTNGIAFHTYTGASYGAVVSGKTYVGALNATHVCRGTVSLTLPGSGLESLQCGTHGVEVTNLGRAFNATQVHNTWLLNDGSRVAAHTCLYYGASNSNNICHIRYFDFPAYGEPMPTNMNHTVMWTGTAGKSVETMTLTETARSATGARRYILTQTDFYSGFTSTTGVPYHAAVSASGAVGSWVRAVPLPTEEPYTSLTVGPTPGPLTQLLYTVCDPTARTATHCVGVNDVGVHQFFFPGGMAADVSTTPNDARLGQSILTGCDAASFWTSRMDPRMAWATTGEKGHQFGMICQVDGSSARTIMMFQFNTGAGETADAGFRMHRAEKYTAARDAFASYSNFHGTVAFDPKGNGFYVVDNAFYGSGDGSSDPGYIKLLRATFDAITNTPRIGPVAEEASGFLILDTWMPPATGATEDSDGNAPLAEEGCSSSKVTFERSEDYTDSDGHLAGAATNKFIFQLTHAAAKRFATSSVDAPNRIRINLRTPNGTAINTGLDADLRGEGWTYTYPANLYFPTRNQTLDGWFDVRVTCVDPHFNPEVSSEPIRMLLSSSCVSYGLDPAKQCQSCHAGLTPSGTLCLGCTNGKFGPDCTLSVDDCAKQMCGDGTTSHGDCEQPTVVEDANGDDVSSGVTCACDTGRFGAGCDMTATQCRNTRCNTHGDCATAEAGCTCDDAFEGATCGSCSTLFTGTLCNTCANALHNIAGGCETCLNGGVHPGCNTCADVVVSGVTVPVFFERGNCSGYDPSTGTVVVRTKAVCDREVCGHGDCLVGGGCDCDKGYVLSEDYVNNDATFMADVNNKACVPSTTRQILFISLITLASVVSAVAGFVFVWQSQTCKVWRQGYKKT